MLLGYSRMDALLLSVASGALLVGAGRLLPDPRARALAAALLAGGSLAAEAALLALHLHVFAEYSARFGSLSGSEFASMNALMDSLRSAAGHVFVWGLCPAGPLVLYATARARRALPHGPLRRWGTAGGVALGCAALLGAAFGFLASFMPGGGGMIG